MTEKTTCTTPPDGWACSRPDGHEGPCAATPMSNPDHTEIATAICRSVAELGDRNSPTDWPEAMLVTSEELHAIVLAQLEELAPTEAAAMAATVPAGMVRVQMAHKVGLDFEPFSYSSDGMSLPEGIYAMYAQPVDADAPVADQPAEPSPALTPSEQRRLLRDPVSIRHIMDQLGVAYTESDAMAEPGEMEPWPPKRWLELRDMGRKIIAEDVDLWDLDVLAAFGLDSKGMPNGHY